MSPPASSDHRNERNPIVINALAMSSLGNALRLGAADMRRAPSFALFFAGVYVLGGWALLRALIVSGEIWWTIPISFGFPLLGPFVAVGFYEISRRFEAGLPVTWPGVLGVILREKDRQIPTLAALMMIFFLFWNFIAHMIFALFMGLQVMTNVTSSLEVYLTWNGLAFLGVGTLVGALFSVVLYAVSVVSLPLLLDREVDFVTAMITSWQVVARNSLVMMVWALIVGGLLLLAMLPGLLGLFLVLPWLGHASWHLYRAALQPE